MPDVFVELRFTRVGPEAHAAVLAQINAMPSARVVHDHSEPRGWFERARLSVPEWACRVVLRAHDPGGDQDDHDTLGDPYREYDFDGRIRRIPPPLVELIAELSAEAALIERGRLEFATREYEPHVLDSLVEELEELDELGGRMVAATWERRDDVLHARIEGAIDRVNQFAHRVRRSGLVDPERVRVSYA
ncbi:hypothetical protein ACNOYE_00350 [Nannocystaceae bacterium ST9]